MLVHPWDAPNHDDEWRAVLHEFDFGQLVAPGDPARDLPVVVPTHFTFDGEHTVELHLARPNPVWRALAERPRALSPRVTPSVDVESDRRLLPGIGGLRLTITGVNAKFKFGGNKTSEHRADIAVALQARGGRMDSGARRRLLNRLARTD